MKILYSVNARIPTEKAHGYQIMKVCESFRRNNIKVELVVPFRTQTKEMKKVKDVYNHYGITKKFKITKIHSFDLTLIDPYLSLRIERLASYFQAISFALFATFYSLLKKADVYYTRDPFFAFFFGSLKFLHKRKIYFEAHIFEPFVCKVVKKGWINGLIVITRKLYEFYTEEGIPEEKILVAPDGVDLKMFDISVSKEKAREDLEIPLDKKVILYTGHLYDWKGAHVLAMSMKNFSDDHVCYFVGGTEDDIPKIKEFVEGEKISNAVIVGYVPPTMVPKYLAASDVVILPNIKKRLWRYTSPLKLFEYMAAKRPIVASNLPSIKEILNEENAILVESGNPKALAEGIKKVLNNNEIANKIVENAYEDVQEYTWDKRAKRIRNFIFREVDE